MTRLLGHILVLPSFSAYTDLYPSTDFRGQVGGSHSESGHSIRPHQSWMSIPHRAWVLKDCFYSLYNYFKGHPIKSSYFFVHRRFFRFFFTAFACLPICFSMFSLFTMAPHFLHLTSVFCGVVLLYSFAGQWCFVGGGLCEGIVMTESTENVFWR